MTDSWASYKNEEKEVMDFINWLGGINDDWTERGDAKWAVTIEHAQLLYFPKHQK